MQHFKSQKILLIKQTAVFGALALWQVKVKLFFTSININNGLDFLELFDFEYVTGVTFFYLQCNGDELALLNVLQCAKTFIIFEKKTFKH